MFGFIKKIFIGLLASVVSAYSHTKCVTLRNQKFKIQLILINLHPNEYNQELYYYPFVDKLDRFVGSRNTLDEISNKICVPDKTGDLNLSVFNMITGINELKMLAKHVSSNVNVNFYGRKCNSN